MNVKLSLAISVILSLILEGLTENLPVEIAYTTPELKNEMMVILRMVMVAIQIVKSKTCLVVILPLIPTTVHLYVEMVTGMQTRNEMMLITLVLMVVQKHAQVKLITFALMIQLNRKMFVCLNFFHQ